MVPTGAVGSEPSRWDQGPFRDAPATATLRFMASLLAPPLERRSSAGFTAVERALVLAEVLLAIGAVGGAIGLMSGALDLRESVDDLPRRSPVLAGMALGVCNGIFPLLVVGATRRHARWAPVGHVAVGIVLMTWIVVQIAYIGLNSPLQVVYAAYGTAVAALGLRNMRDRREPARV